MDDPYSYEAEADYKARLGWAMAAADPKAQAKISGVTDGPPARHAGRARDDWGEFRRIFVALGALWLAATVPALIEALTR